ncbi:hypothetical protein GGU10DRAFT_416429 [Lentinula aff. detonsa]|uniref:Uncharacterized protein n=1 Tax=Lentinula aff. detonsa TaxID=2804958 RepID=A0AA38NDK8_9AGAR|nr:hypothetical protein GGU10DRAFT_416429 [Lentinula aff. detonsa]
MDDPLRAWYGSSLIFFWNIYKYFKLFYNTKESSKIHPAYRSTLQTHESASIHKFLLIQGLISTFWAITLIIFSSGVVPIYWGLSQYGTQHTGVTNVIVTGVATLATSHLHYTVQHAAAEYVAMGFYNGITLERWSYMQGIAQGSIWPPFEFKWNQWKHTWKQNLAWLLWILTWSSMGLHSASISAILQPQPTYQHVLFDDLIPCGVDPNILSVNSSLNVTVQSQLDQIAFGVGLQLGSYYNQLAGNTTTAFATRAFVKDNYGYAAIGGLINGLQEMPGVAINAQCSNTPHSPPLASLWSSVFPGLSLPSINTINGSSYFNNSISITPTSSQAIITSAPTFNLTGFQQAMYAIVNASGSGGIITLDGQGNTLGCVWNAIPKLVHVEIFNWTAFTLYSEDATSVPVPVGNAVVAAVRGMAEAINLGAHLDDGYGAGINPLMHIETREMLQVLIADGIKGSVQSYTDYCFAKSIYNPNCFLNNTSSQLAQAQTQVCRSNNRTIQQHWRFGNENNLGWLAIVLTMGFGLLTLYMVWRLWKKPQIKGIDPFKVVDGFDMGMHYDMSRSMETQVFQVKNRQVVGKQQRWDAREGSDELELMLSTPSSLT